MRRLSLDHITVVDTTPSQLVETAASVGCAGVCLFLQPMAVLPAMPEFALVGDTPERRKTRDALRATGVTIDLVYPFTLAGRTEVLDFEPVLDTAAFLGAGLANVLCYDRDPARRIDKLGALAALAGGYGIALAIEFYPPSQVPSLSAAFATIDALPDCNIGVTLDLLHLVRAGEMPAMISHLADPRIRLAQLCDGPADIDPNRIEWEAGLQRDLPGEGAFALSAFLAALPPGLPLSVEVPREDALERGVPMLDRAREAVAATRNMLPEATA